MGGFPQDGDEYSEDQQPTQAEGRRRDTSQEPDPFADLRREMDALRRDNESLRRAIPPAAPAPAPEPEAEPDWETLIFQDPKEALRLHGERIREQTKRELRGEYQQEQGTQRFWEEFYREHSDLSDDHDLVSSTMNKHIAEIANLPVSEAMDRLADLTRQRIVKYSKRGGESRRTRAIAEGSNAPTPRAAAVPETNVTTLSSLIKARRAKRRGTAA